MLNIEQPNANRRGSMKIGPWIMRNGPGPISQISRATTMAIPALVDIVEIQGVHPAAAHETERGAMLEQEEIAGADPEHHQRMAIEPIGEALAPVEAQVFVDGQRLDVAHASPAEIAGRRMMGRVRALPVIVRGQREDAEGASDPVIDRAGAKKAPCPQSCWIMKSRTRNPAAGKARARVSQ